MVEDKNKHMTVQYNFLNLPTSVDFGSGNKIEWAYTVTGAKLRKTVYTNGTVTLTQDYVSGFVYKNGSLDFFATETGRMKVQSGGTMRHEYNLTDHLGNVRVTFDETGTAIEESHYYAFGMRIEGLSTSSPDNKFTYNGKELEDDDGLNWYHYGARFYDAQIGRWHVVDPIDEFNSPYTYVGNDPINLYDPDGMGADDPPEKVALDAGHGGDASGATFNGILEKDLTAIITQGAAASLELQKVDYVRTREGDDVEDAFDNSWRLKKAKDAGATMYVSFHIDAAGEGETTRSGLTVFYKAGDEESKVLAQAIASVPALQNYFGSVKAQEAKYNRDGNPNWQPYIRNFNSGPAVLIEVGFINNPSDLKTVQNWGTDIGMSLGVGIGDYARSQKK
jgi:RHS repeat-associated protein